VSKPEPVPAGGLGLLADDAIACRLIFGDFLNRPALGQLIDFVEIENVLSYFDDRIANQDFIVSAVAGVKFVLRHFIVSKKV
jgi:hypothetical protein